MRSVIATAAGLAAIGAALLWVGSTTSLIETTVLDKHSGLVLCFWKGAVHVAYFVETEDEALPAAKHLGPPRFHTNLRRELGLYLDLWRLTAESDYPVAPQALFSRTPLLPGRFQRAYFRFPLWFAFVVLAAYPTLAFIRGPVRRWRRRKRGLCVQCGYNLTGLTEPRCPECGERM